MTEPLAGKVALVTGAGGGIGRAIACALVAAGAETWVVGRTQATLEETAAFAPDRVRVRPLDLTQPGQAETLVRELEDANGLDVLVHCAGIIQHGRIEATPVDSFDDQFAANVRAFYVLAQQALPLLRRGPGYVVVVNSTIIFGKREGVAQFAATQHALRSLTDTLRQEVNADGIRVLTVFPGRTASSRQERLTAEENRPYDPDVLLQPEDLATMIIAAVTLPATAEVTELHIRPTLKSY